jgi:hypothetical protein
MNSARKGLILWGINNLMERAETFKGHLLLIPYIFFFCLGVALATVMIMAGLERPFIPFLMAIVPFSIVLQGMRQLFYFKLTATDLIIKNHTWPWFARTYKLSEIQSVILQVRTKTDTLRLQTTDLRSIRYGAGSLRRKHWMALGEALQKRGIPVQNELPGVKLFAPSASEAATAETR